MGYEKRSLSGSNSDNSRNGYSDKTIISDYGESEIAVPRDLSGQFEPRILEKRRTRTNEIGQKIMAMHAKGMSQRDIEDSLREIYGAQISQTLISKITDKILPEVIEWQKRPLASIYPIVYFDGIVFKIRRNSQIINKRVSSLDSIRKAVYLSEREITKKWTMPVRERGMAYSQIMIFFADRFSA